MDADRLVYRMVAEAERLSPAGEEAEQRGHRAGLLEAAERVIDWASANEGGEAGSPAQLLEELQTRARAVTEEARSFPDDREREGKRRGWCRGVFLAESAESEPEAVGIALI